MSQLSTISTVPSELLLQNDDEFVEEVSIVDDLYFINQEDSSNNEIVSDEESPTHFESDASDDDSEHFQGISYLDHSEIDKKEYEKQESFKSKTCGCKLYDGPCSNELDWEAVLELREHCQELSREDLDITIKAELFSHRRTGSHTDSKKHKVKERERPYQVFYFLGKRVCRETFCFLHDISRGTLLTICQSLDKDGSIGLSARVHGRTGKSPKHALSLTDRERIKTFLCKYARDNALPLPGRLPNYKNSNVLLLPSDKTTQDIHKVYESVASEMTFRSVSLRTFQRTWKELCPHIVLSKPCTDLCEKCQQFAVKIANSGNMNETEKQDLLSLYQQHIQYVKGQRDHYRTMVLESKESFASLSEEQSTSGM